MIHKSLPLFTLLCTATFSTSFAQDITHTVKGKVVDATDNNAIAYVTVNIRTDSMAVKSLVTDAKGEFELTELATGNYMVTFIAVGYQTEELPIELLDNTAELNLGSISLAADAQALDEVVVTANRPIVKQDIDRLTYDVQADPESKVLTALDMMRKIPLLSVDGDENVLLQGNSNYRIFINNKPSTMIARNPKDVLKAMPAESIEKI